MFQANQPVVDGARNTQSVGMSRFLKLEGRGDGVWIKTYSPIAVMKMSKEGPFFWWDPLV